MTEKPTDRRVRRTRHALEDALIELILEKGYDAVTIEEITDRADLGRTTFYLHFRDKEELLMHAIDTMIEDFLIQHDKLHPSRDELIENIQFHPERLNLYGTLLRQIFVHAHENANLYKVILRGQGGPKAMQRLTDISKQEFLRRMQQFSRMDSKVPMDVFAIYFTGSILEMLTWWLEENEPYPIDDMVAHFQQLFVLGALDTMGLAQINLNPSLNQT